MTNRFMFSVSKKNKNMIWIQRTNRQTGLLVHFWNTCKKNVLTLLLHAVNSACYQAERMRDLGMSIFPPGLANDRFKT